MSVLFAETLKKLRTEKGLSQRELAGRIHVTRSAVARWENGNRLPDAETLSRLSACLRTDLNTLLSEEVGSDESSNVIMVDDNKIILSHGLAVLEQVMPHATVTGFIWPQEAIEYAKTHQIALAILDIELGMASGLDLCQTLLEINPRTNVVFLTAYADHSLNAWKTKASGFMLKPLTPEGLQEQLGKLRYPFPWDGTGK